MAQPFFLILGPMGSARKQNSNQIKTPRSKNPSRRVSHQSKEAEPHPPLQIKGPALSGAERVGHPPVGLYASLGGTGSRPELARWREKGSSLCVSHAGGILSACAARQRKVREGWATRPAAIQSTIRLTAEAGIGVLAGTRLLTLGGIQVLTGTSLLGLSVDLVRQSMELQEQVQAQANVFLSRMEHLLQPDELALLSTEELQGTLSQLRQVSNSAAAGLLTRKQDIRLLMVIQGVEDEIRRREEEERKEKERKKKEEEEIP